MASNTCSLEIRCDTLPGQLYTVADGDEILFACTCDFGAGLGVEK